MIHCLDQVIKPKLTHTNYNLLGRLATISSGNARPGFSAQARVRDEFGQLHYVQVEPEYGELELYSQVILVKVHKSHYVAKKILYLKRSFRTRLILNNSSNPLLLFCRLYYGLILLFSFLINYLLFRLF